jgi:formylglycine-generating enzyme required for sulfatase activity
MTAAVDTLQNSRGTVIPNSLSDLDRLPREQLLNELQARYLIAEGERKLPLAYGLARLGSVDAGFLTSQIVSAADRECSNIVSALNSARRDARRLIESRIMEAEERADWQAKSRLAIVNSYLGYPNAITEMFSIDTRDPIQRTILIDVFPRWNAGLDMLADLLETTASPSLRSGLCLAIGSLGQAADSDTKRRWHAILAECYLNQADTGTHGAADWALRQWGFPEPKAYLRRADKDFGWLVTPNGLTMLRVPAGTLRLKRDEKGADKEIGVTNDYLISDREISTGLFRTFLMDDYAGPKPVDWEAAERYVSPTDAHPVQRTSWVDAVQFCNWLSTKEGLVPCYRSLEGERGGQVWKFVDGSNGYSLPTEAQWEYACRAGTVTRFSSGDDDSLVVNYAVFRREEQPRVGGTKMCNGWGLFDMHGNLWEWCCDRTDVVVPASGTDGHVTDRALRGGCYGNRGNGIQSSQRDTHPCTHRSSALGFRVVRQLGASGGAGGDTDAHTAAAGGSTL